MIYITFELSKFAVKLCSWKTEISQGSVTTHLRWGGTFNSIFLHSSLPNVSLNSEKIIKIGLCRVLSLSDCRYSLNPLSQTRIDW